MPLSQAQSNVIGGALASVLIGGALVGGYSFFSSSSTQTHVVVDWPDGSVPPEGLQCTWFTGLMQYSGGATKYGYAHACALLPDGGRDAPLPANLIAVSEPDRVEGYDGGPRLEVWSVDDADAPWPCACSTGSNCQSPDWMGALADAPLGLTLQPGWSGAGCKKMMCTVLGGVPYWPSECPLQ